MLFVKTWGRKGSLSRCWQNANKSPSRRGLYQWRKRCGSSPTPYSHLPISCELLPNSGLIFKRGWHLYPECYRYTKEKTLHPYMWERPMVRLWVFIWAFPSCLSVLKKYRQRSPQWNGNISRRMWGDLKASLFPFPNMHQRQKLLWVLLHEMFLILPWPPGLTVPFWRQQRGCASATC